MSYTKISNHWGYMLQYLVVFILILLQCLSPLIMHCSIQYYRGNLKIKVKNDFSTVVMDQFMPLTYSDNSESTWKALAQQWHHTLKLMLIEEKSTFPVKRCQVSTYSAYTALWITLVLSIQGQKQIELQGCCFFFQTQPQWKRRTKTVGPNFNIGRSFSIFLFCINSIRYKIRSVKWKSECTVCG